MYFRQCPNILDQLEHFCVQYFGSQEMQTLRTLIYHLINKLMFVYLPLNPEFSTSWLLVRAERHMEHKQKSKSGRREASNAVSLWGALLTPKQICISITEEISLKYVLKPDHFLEDNRFSWSYIYFSSPFCFLKKKLP